MKIKKVGSTKNIVTCRSMPMPARLEKAVRFISYGRPEIDIQPLFLIFQLLRACFEILAKAILQYLKRKVLQSSEWTFKIFINIPTSLPFDRYTSVGGLVLFIVYNYVPIS